MYRAPVRERPCQPDGCAGSRRTIGVLHGHPGLHPVLLATRLVPRVDAGHVQHRQVSDLESFTQLTVRSIDGRPLPLQADGDYLGEVQEARYSILPRALNVIA